MRSHFTLHGPSGVTVTCSHTPAGYDAVAFIEDGSRSHLVDDVSTPRSLWVAARWITEIAELGSVDDLGEVLMIIASGADSEEIESDGYEALSNLIESLRSLTS